MEAELQDLITLLKNAVKDSHLKDQKHIDLTLINASERHVYQEALIKVKKAVKDGVLSEEELKSQLGLS